MSTTKTTTEIPSTETTPATDLIPEPAVHTNRALTSWRRLAGPAHPTTVRGGLRLFVAGFVVLVPLDVAVFWPLGIWLRSRGIQL